MKTFFRLISVLPALALTAVLVTSGTPNAFAQLQVVPTITLSIDGVEGQASYAPAYDNVRLGADGKTWEMIHSMDLNFAGAANLTIDELRYDPDPIVFNSILIQNPTAATQVYTVGIALPTVWPGPNLIRGSIDTSVIGEDATVSTVAGFPIYTAQIDFATVKTLQNHLFSLSTPQGAISSGASFGFEVNAIPVTANIGIQLRFSLSPGDTVAIISDFEVVAIPEPGTLALLLLGGGLLAWRRQRQ